MASQSEILDGLGLTGRDDLFLDDIVVDQGHELGRGSYAVVRKATWQGADVAVKVLHRVLIECVDPQARAAQLIGFGDEIDKIRRLNHPNLTQFLGIAQVDNGPALVVELMSCSLLQCCVGRNRQDDVTLLGYLADTAAGLRFLHSRQIIHRDLAPKNVLVRDGRAKLCDFGVAKFIGSGLAEQLRRMVGRTECPGTLLYMPPEALSSPAIYDESLDVFAFGVLAFCVLSGHEPSVELLQSPRMVQVVTNGWAEAREIPERVRRAPDISRVPDEHALKTMLVQCVANAKAERPTAAMVQERVSAAARMARSLVVSSVSHTPTPGVDVQLQTVLRSLQQITNQQQQLLERQVAVEAGYTQIHTLLNQQAPELRQLATSQAELQRSLGSQNAAVQEVQRHVSDVCTQVEGVRTQVEGVCTEVEGVRTEVGEVLAQVDTGVSGVLNEVGEVREYFDAQVTDVLNKVEGVRTEVGEVRAHTADLVTEVGEVRTGVEGVCTQVKEVRAQIDTLVTDTGTGVTDVLTQVTGVRAEVGEVRSHVETRVGGVFTEVEGVLTEVKRVRTEVGEVHTQVEALVEDSRTGITDVLTQVTGVRAEVGEVHTQVGEVHTQVGEVGIEVQIQGRQSHQAPALVDSTAAPALPQSHYDDHRPATPVMMENVGLQGNRHEQPSEAVEPSPSASYSPSPLRSISSGNQTIQGLRKVGGRKWSERSARMPGRADGPHFLTSHRGVYYFATSRQLFKSTDFEDWTHIDSPDVSEFEGLAAGPSGVFVYGNRTFNSTMGLLHLEGDYLVPYASSIEGVLSMTATAVTSEHVLMFGKKLESRVKINFVHAFHPNSKEFVIDSDKFPTSSGTVTPTFLVVGECIYALGCVSTPPSPVKSLQISGSDTRFWKRVPFLPSTHNDVGAASMGDCVFVAGGLDISQFRKSCFAFDIRDGSLCSLPDLPVPCLRPLLCVRGNTLIAIGGYDSDGKWRNTSHELDIS